MFALGPRRAYKQGAMALSRDHKELDHKIVKQVLDYFVQNPKTADTLEGITRWRLLRERVQKSLRETEAAIDWLVERDYLEKVLVAGGKDAIFRLNPGRRSDALRLLSKRGPARKIG